MKKRWLALLLAVVMVISMAACAGSGTSEPSGAPEVSSDESVASSDVGSSLPQTDDDLKNGEVQVEGGVVSGVPGENENVTIYKGIPYAAPPVGDLRWVAPQPVEPWEDVKVCDTFSNICPQGTEAYGWFQKEFYFDPYPEMSEDCLYLNVWTPANAADEKLPVLVYIHGGGFGSGWSHEVEFDGEGFAADGVILVTINYRLGVFGFLAHPELSEESENDVSGNYGLLDQMAALEWVKKNISGFGGDPNNVTVAGQSAGAMSICDLVVSPLAQGLIDKAIILSGDGINTEGDDGTPLEAQEQLGLEVAELFEADSIEALRQVPADELYEAVSTSQLPSATAGYMSFSPCVDGYVMSDSSSNLMSQGKYLDIPYIVGYTTEDIPSLIPGTIALADKQAELGRGNTYLYEFARQMPGGDDLGAFHSAELWYVFDTMDRCWRPFTDADYVLADEISTSFSNFARTGNPNGENVPQWDAYTTENKFTMVFDVKG